MYNVIYRTVLVQMGGGGRKCLESKGKKKGEKKKGWEIKLFGNAVELDLVGALV